MVRGLSGSLLSHEAVSRFIFETLADCQTGREPDAARRRMRTWHATVRATLGPTANARTVLDLVAVPLVSHLGFRSVVIHRAPAPPYALLHTGIREAGVLLATAWGQDPAGAWRDAVTRGVGHDVRWCFCVNGPALRLFDAKRLYSRRFAEFDIALAIDDEATFKVLWGLLRATAMTTPGDSTLDCAVERSERHRASVRDSLQGGVHDALAHLAGAFVSTAGRRRADGRAIDESLVVIYRVLFLLFAEARGLVPQWHPVYRDGYTVESLRACVETETRPTGLWESLQAIARLAHRGCRAGTLTVAPFNGRLFSPADAPLAESLRLDDEPVRRALLALTTRESREGRERIAYADLGVEQLGAVYEHVLDYAAVSAGRHSPIELRPSGRRKATGTFYTPRALTEYLVRRTLAPLVDGLSAEEILELRVLDPAMGSGAFLVSACRYLAHAYEQAVVRDGGVAPSGIGDADRAGFRRTIAQRCLYGVDINPMAVQLARLSLWLATLARDRPLTFLDHHLRTGDSLVGASLEDIHRQRPSSRAAASRMAPLPLFAFEALESELRGIVPPRLALAADAGETLEQVKSKERTLARLTAERGPLSRWRAAADLWCAGWFSESLRGATFGALLHEVLDGRGPLPAHVSGPLLQDARATAARGGFFHWTLEFPEAFYGEDGAPLGRRGFDAVIGNPPWDMLREDRIASGAPAGLTRFARQSGIYRLQGTGHANLYQLFVERALALMKPAGRLGFIVPAGLAVDHGCGALRREILGRTTVDTFLTIENRDAIFPIHRGLKFTLFTLTGQGATTVVPLRAGVREVAALDRLPDRGPDPDSVPLTAALLDRLGGDEKAIPEIRSRADLDVVSRMAMSCPALGSADGWNLQFGRELNATDDRRYFVDQGEGFPVVEGKHLQPFRVDSARARLRISSADARRLLPSAPFAGPRLAYRDVASATNRLTLIAAIVPPWVVTTHTVFCVKTPPDIDAQHFLCGIFNSFVANYFVRMRVSTHVTAALMRHLPVPKPARDNPSFRRLGALSRLLSEGHEGAAAMQQAVAARLYGLSVEAFARVLDAFPLVPRAERDGAHSAFRSLVETPSIPEITES
jgi:hypothetical protein